MTKLYWVSFIILYDGADFPSVCALTGACLSIEEAKEKILYQRKNYTVLSAWIDTYTETEGKEKETVFHECYLTPLGEVKKPEE
ncbi:MAG: hypothetical protein LUD16_12815 [Lachnospiraceae bacterium]|nr:hypothetical protein [Lachnospiraceae bacterium]